MEDGVFAAQASDCGMLDFASARPWDSYGAVALSLCSRYGGIDDRYGC